MSDKEIPESQTETPRAGGAAPDVPAGKAGGSPVAITDVPSTIFRLWERENADYWAERRAFDDEMQAIREKAKTDAL